MRPVSKSLNINAEVKKCFSVCFKRTDIWLRIINQPPYTKESTRKYIQRVEKISAQYIVVDFLYTDKLPYSGIIFSQTNRFSSFLPFQFTSDKHFYNYFYGSAISGIERILFCLSYDVLLEHKHRIQQTSDDLEILAIQHLHGVPIVSEYDDGMFLQQSIRFEWNHSILLIDTGCLFSTNECQQLCFFRWKGLSLQLNVKLH